MESFTPNRSPDPGVPVVQIGVVTILLRLVILEGFKASLGDGVQTLDKHRPP